MPKMTVALDGVVIKEIELSKVRTTLGRRPYNDIVIDNLAVSGEHAAIVLHGGRATLEDLNSTNGTHLNGKAVKSEALRDQDLIRIGRYRIRFEQTPCGAPPARIRVLDGPAAGREAELVKAYTTLGKPGVAVVSIARRDRGYELARVGGQTLPQVNGQPVDKEPVVLENEDLIELADIRMQFLQG